MVSSRHRSGFALRLAGIADLDCPKVVHEEQLKEEGGQEGIPSAALAKMRSILRVRLLRKLYTGGHRVQNLGATIIISVSNMPTREQLLRGGRVSGRLRGVL